MKKFPIHYNGRKKILTNLIDVAISIKIKIYYT